LKKKVAIIIKSLKNGGAERVVSVLSNSFNKNYDFDIILFDSRGIDYSYSGNIIDLKFYKLDTKFFKIFHFLKLLIKKYKLYKIKYKNNYDCVISFVTNTNKLHMQTYMKNQKNIITVHNNVSIQKNFKTSNKNKLLLSNLYKKADEIIAVSEGVKYDLHSYFDISNEKIKVIYNPININEILEFEDETIQDNKLRSIFEKHDVLINVGSLNDQKAQWNLIRSFSEVYKKFPNTRLVIFGRGKYEQKFQTLINGLNLNNLVILAGYSKAIFTYMFKSKLFLMSSSHEGLGMVLIEALACSLPVISTDCKSGPREILAPNTDVTKTTTKLELTEYGYLTPLMTKTFQSIEKPLTKEEYLFSEAIQNILSNNDIYEKMRKNALNRAKDFDLLNVSKIWKELI